MPTEKWYEKKWGVGLMLIICFPVGVILLWKNPRYSNTAKGGITAASLFLILYNPLAADKPVFHNTESTYTKSSNSYVVGYLRQGATWENDNGRSHKNSNLVKVEVTGNTLVMADGIKRVQTYFLEGDYAGVWGYTTSGSISK